MSDYTFAKADNDLFAVYQTIYSQADIEMWFSWEHRLNDTKGCKDCFFLCRGDDKLGGAVISGGAVRNAFLVPPFDDHSLFWRLVIEKAKSLTKKAEIICNGVLAGEVETLRSLGVRVWRPRQIMCRPTDVLPYSLPAGFTLEAPTQADIPEIAKVAYTVNLGSISEEMFGRESLRDVKKEVKKSFAYFAETGTMEQCSVIRGAENKIVGGCVAGVYPKMPHRFAFIADVFVLPEFRGQGLAGAMLRHALTMAHPKTPLMKLHVLVDNPAANLYHKLGFIPGPVFTDMKYSRKE